MDLINGFYDDDGNKINPELVKKPGLCLLCKKNDEDDSMENILCMITRHDQRNEEEFVCGAFERKNE
jgi:hypothetical protein